MQRVKGLMTGSLPTFIDAGSNFASSAVGEDHLVYHFNRAFHVTLLGDDTWVHLFPDSIDTAYASDSFKMFDLHTVDNRILDKLWTEVAQPRKQVLLAHFLGVDHCGHTYGPDHPNMADKLAQMNTVIERLVDQFIDDSTLLVVMGDHGMSVEGDHGGESVEELMSTLFLYSKRPLTSTDTSLRDLYHRIHAARQRVLGYDVRDISDRLQYDASRYPIVSQIHLVPSLAYLMGVPIPFGNLGAILPDVLNPPVTQQQSDPLLTLQHMVLQYRKNAVQVHTYLTRYAAYDAAFAPHALQDKLAYLWAAEAALLRPGAAQDRALLEQAVLDYDAFLIHTLQYCEAIWAQFDVTSMVLGIAVLACGVLISLWFLFSSSITYDTLWLVAGLLVQALTLGSNSFVVWEDQGTRFVAATLCVVWLVQDHAWILPLAVLAWIRLTGSTGLCREEQFPYCDAIQ
ncbi:alkaline-phosphatase-like protein, partial [Syncephalastrum racemosum]